MIFTLWLLTLRECDVNESKFKNHLLQQKVKYACSFYEYQENEGPEAGVKRKRVLYHCWAYVPQWK